MDRVVAGPAQDSARRLSRRRTISTLFRRAAAEGSFEAASILEGVQAVARGDSDLLQTAYRCHAEGEQQWCLLTATPFQHPDGGVVARSAG